MQDSYIERTKTPEQMLGRVIEEAGEVLHIAGKIIRFCDPCCNARGPHWFNWLGTNPEEDRPVREREANREALRREMRDLGHAMFKLEQAFQAEDEAVAEDMQNA